MPKGIPANPPVLTRAELIQLSEEQETLLRECWLMFRRINRLADCRGAGFELRGALEMSANMAARLEETGYGY